MSDKLTPKQEAFVREYLIDLNAQAAYRRAGYVARNDNVAAASASKMLNLPKVASALAAAQKERSLRATVTADQVVRELALVAFSDPTRYTIDPATGVLQIDQQANPDAWRAVSSVKRRVRNTPGATDVEVEFKLWPKVEALKLLGQHLGLFPTGKKPSDGEQQQPIAFILVPVQVVPHASDPPAFIDASPAPDRDRDAGRQAGLAIQHASGAVEGVE